MSSWPSVAIFHGRSYGKRMLDLLPSWCCVDEADIPKRLLVFVFVLDTKQAKAVVDDLGEVELCITSKLQNGFLPANGVFAQA